MKKKVTFKFFKTSSHYVNYVSEYIILFILHNFKFKIWFIYIYDVLYTKLKIMYTCICEHAWNMINRMR